MAHVEELRFPAGDEIPNNPALPALAYRGVEEIARGPAACEQLFTANGWSGPSPPTGRSRAPRSGPTG